MEPQATIIITKRTKTIEVEEKCVNLRVSVEVAKCLRFLSATLCTVPNFREALHGKRGKAGNLTEPELERLTDAMVSFYNPLVRAGFETNAFGEGLAPKNEEVC